MGDKNGQQEWIIILFALAFVGLVIYDWIWTRQFNERLQALHRRYDDVYKEQTSSDTATATIGPRATTTPGTGGGDQRPAG